VKRNHVIFYKFISQIHCILKDLNFFRSISVLSAVMKIKNGFDIFLVENNFLFVMSQPVIKNIDNGFDKNIKKAF